MAMASSSKESALKANLLGKREAEDDLKTKPVLKKHKEKSEETDSTERFADSLQQIIASVELLETKSDHANFISAKEVPARKKTLFVANLSPQTKISDIIKFFENEVVTSVRLILTRKGVLLGYGFVKFASANEAKKALEEKTGEYLCGRNIFLDVAEISSDPPKYCIDHKVWYEDYLRRESLLIEEDETVKGFDEHPDFDEEVPARKNTLFFANVSPQAKISYIKKFFQNAGIAKIVGNVVSVRLVVNKEGEHVGCGFVEFASDYGAKKALEEKNGEYLCGHKIFLQLPQIAPHTPQHKYTLTEMLWYEDYLSCLPEEDDLETKEKSDETVPMVSVFCGKKITFSDDD